MWFLYKYVLLFLLSFVYITKYSDQIEEERALASESVSTSPQENRGQVSVLDKCPVWFFYNNSTGQCECYSSINYFNGPESTYPNGIKCSGQKAFIAYNHYMTYSEKRELVFSYSFYYDPSGFEKPAGEPGYIELPRNISELNDRMCKPANRRGILCSECIDGFGPSVTSSRFKCTNCTSTHAYGVVVYLLIEFVPVIVFYFIILISQINLTSAPMVCYIFYSQLVYITINYIIGDPDTMKYQISVVSTFHGPWNLDFIRYAIPPFCVSPKLNVLSAFYIQCVSTIFPYFLIGVTWVLIELHSRNCVILVWLWAVTNRFLPKCIVKVTRKPETTVINTFASFFLLSYAKLAFMLLLLICPFKVYNIDEDTHRVSITLQLPFDPAVNYRSELHIPQMIFAVFMLLVATFIPILLLALYPIRAFRMLLFKCCPSRFMGALTTFVEKFYSCYRDGLDGGQDMRSFASLYFIIIVVIYIMWRNAYQFYFLAALLIGCSALISIIQPYKEKYMARTDALILANAAIQSITIDKINFDGFYGDQFYQIIFQTVTVLPMVWFFCFSIFNVFKTKLKAMFNLAREQLLCCNSLLRYGERILSNRIKSFEQDENLSDNLPDRMLRPKEYMQWGYDSIS